VIARTDSRGRASRRSLASGQAARRRAADALYYASLGLLAAVFLFPFFWTVASSLKEIPELFSFPPTILPAVPQWENYARVLEKVPFLTWVWNTLVLVVLSTLGTIGSGSLAAYAFARFRFPGRDLLFVLTLATLMLPAQVTLIPQYFLFHQLGWINTLKPLWVPAWFGGGAFTIFLLRQFLMTLPRELDEAGMIDGASPFRIYWAILMPLCKPALATVAIISIIGRWNEFLEPLVYLTSSDTFTLAVGLQYFKSVPERAGTPMEHLLMAASVMTIAPCLVLFFCAQRYFVRGIALSGIKG
jgi:multiple sugar transport system permease protein